MNIWVVHEWFTNFTKISRYIHGVFTVYWMIFDRLWVCLFHIWYLWTVVMSGWKRIWKTTRRRRWTPWSNLGETTMGRIVVLENPKIPYETPHRNRGLVEDSQILGTIYGNLWSVWYWGGWDYLPTLTPKKGSICKQYTSTMEHMG